LSARESGFGFGWRVVGGSGKGSAGGGSTVLRERGFLIGFVALAASLVFLAGDVLAQPRGTHTRNASPASAPTGHQTEPVDLNEGKSPAELFRGGCAVRHQSATGLAKGRREGELT